MAVQDLPLFTPLDPVYPASSGLVSCIKTERDDAGSFGFLGKVLHILELSELLKSSEKCGWLNYGFDSKGVTRDY